MRVPRSVELCIDIRYREPDLKTAEIDLKPLFFGRGNLGTGPTFP